MNKFELIDQFVATGILQFGSFQLAENYYSPIGFHLSLLPSFPKLMNATADLMQPFFEIQSERDRLLSMPETSGLGGVIAVKTNIPMMYPRDQVKSYTAAYSIEGTADVGNPTKLLTNVLIHGRTEAPVISLSNRVGLPVNHCVAIIDCEMLLIEDFEDITIESLFTLAEIIDYLRKEEHITTYMANAIRKWQSEASR